MNAYRLPTSLEVGSFSFSIRTDYDVILDILDDMENPDYSDWVKAEILGRAIYPDWKSIPDELKREALEKAVEFIDMGQKPDGQSRPRLMDWRQDAPLIISAVNAVSGYDIRTVPHLHWWSFLSAYMGIGDSLFSAVISIRAKQARGEKLEKHERKFLNENYKMVNLETRYSDEDKALMEQFGITV